jgi:hypothetical protein
MSIAEIVLANRGGFAACRDLLAEVGNDGAQVFGGERRGGVERRREVLTWQKAAHGASSELALSELAGEPLAAGGAEKRGSNDRHARETSDLAA